MEYNEPLMVRVQGDLDKRKVYLSPIAATLAANPTSDNIPRVLVTPKSTSTQSKHTKGTSMGTIGMGNQRPHGGKMWELMPALQALHGGGKAKPVIITNVEENVTNIYDPYNKVFPKDQQTITSLRTNSSNGNAWIVEGKDTQIMETQLKLMNDNSPTLTSWWVDFPAKRFLSLVKDMDLTTPEAHSFLMSHGFSPTKDPNIFCLKTSKVYLVTTAAKLSRQSLGFSPTLGMTLNGKFLTQKTSVYPKTENGCSLSDILEENVPDKYFLSEVQTKKILASSGELPKHLV